MTGSPNVPDPANLVRELDAAGAFEELEREEPATPEQEDAHLREAVRLLGGAGILSYLVPASSGGRRERISSRDTCAAREALAYRSGMADLAFVMQGLGSGAICRNGSAEQKAAWLPRLATGRAIAAIGLTEPGAGSDLTAIATRARRDGDHYVIDGEKTLISNAGVAEVTTLWARTSDDPRRGLTAFVIERGDPGFECSGRLRGMAAHPIGSLLLRGCRIPEDRRIGGEGEGMKIVLGVLDFFRPSVGAAAVGFARRALVESLTHMKARVQFGAPLAKQQGLMGMVADMATEIEAAALMVDRAASAIDEGRERTTRESAMAKYMATETACRVVDRAVQIHGGRGVVRGSVVERLYREVRSLRIYEGTSEIQKNIIAREVLRAGS